MAEILHVTETLKVLVLRKFQLNINQETEAIFFPLCVYFGQPFETTISRFDTFKDHLIIYAGILRKTVFIPVQPTAWLTRMGPKRFGRFIELYKQRLASTDAHLVQGIKDLYEERVTQLYQIVDSVMTRAQTGLFLYRFSHDGFNRIGAYDGEQFVLTDRTNRVVDKKKIGFVKVFRLAGNSAAQEEYVSFEI